jgi:hypothetical protein
MPNQKEVCPLANLSERPLDSTTVRVVAELAAALLPPLTAEMREAVGEETAKVAEQVRQVLQETGQDMGETLSSLGHIRKEAGRVSGDILSVLNETLPMLGRAREDIEQIAQRALDALDETLPALHRAREDAGDICKEALAALNEALSSLVSARETIETSGKDAAAILAELRAASGEFKRRASFAALGNSLSAEPMDLTEWKGFEEILASAEERLSAAAVRLESAADGFFSERISNELAELVKRSASSSDPTQSALDGVGADIVKLLRRLEEAIPAWEGFLKADGRAQTKELSELAAEISEIAQDTKIALLTGMRETAEKRAARNAEWKENLIEIERAMERRIARVEKTTLVAGAVSAFLAAGLVALFT